MWVILTQSYMLLYQLSFPLRSQVLYGIFFLEILKISKFLEAGAIKHYSGPQVQG